MLHRLVLDAASLDIETLTVPVYCSKGRITASTVDGDIIIISEMKYAESVYLF